MGSGTITLGLVSVPVKLYSAAEHADAVSFNLLHAKCRSRVKQQYVCPADNEVLTRDDMVKGYEFAKDQFVTFTAEELKALEEQASPAIEIEEFLPIDQVDPVYFIGAYYLGPDKGGDRPYALLAAALRQTRRCGLARWTSRGRQHLVLVRALPTRGLALQVLHYGTEVRSFDDVPVGDTVVKPAELKLAVQLVRNVSAEEFRPARYTDEVLDRMKAAVQRKVEGQEVAIPAAAATPTQVVDLMQALKASLSKTTKADVKAKRAAARASTAPAPRAAAGGRR